MALEMVRRDAVLATDADGARGADAGEGRFSQPIQSGLEWLAGHQNDDGGWGDTTKSLSNISTTMLAHASFHAAGADRFPQTVSAAEEYIERAGGVAAVLNRYGTDRTFSVPILTHCALAGTANWDDVIPLPFELACLPSKFYSAVGLPVVSYALPALIAVGQVRHHFRKPWNPLIRFVRNLACRRSLKTLESIQPVNGGFLEAAPLTSFVTMSLAGMGMGDHVVAQRGVQFLLDSVGDDGGWPIDTNLATWLTTLSVNALDEQLPQADRPKIRDWLLGQQYRNRHPYTNAAPGGWSWTDLPGGVPDADDTPGALLALLTLANGGTRETVPTDDRRPLRNGIVWLLELQNRDGGWPTFCRGWGTLPFDRSAADISAHVLRALMAWRKRASEFDTPQSIIQRAESAVERGFRYLQNVQRSDGSWSPLWFGNQLADDDENPTYGTSRVLAAYRDANRMETSQAQRGLSWLIRAQNSDGGWGGAHGIQSNNEETALAVDLLLSVSPQSDSAQRAVEWLLQRVEKGTYRETTPIGFYFAKLWYFEKLYPQIFVVAALRRAKQVFTELERTQTPPLRQSELQEQAVSE